MGLTSDGQPVHDPWPITRNTFGPKICEQNIVLSDAAITWEVAHPGEENVIAKLLESNESPVRYLYRCIIQKLAQLFVSCANFGIETQNAMYS